MLSRRGFLGWISGLWAIWGAEGRGKGTPVHKRERPAESMQQLIQQIRSLEHGVECREYTQAIQGVMISPATALISGVGSKAHVQAIQDQVRVRLLLAGLACVYVEEDGQSWVCTLETSTGCLWCLPVRQLAQPWARKELERIGLKGLESRVNTLSRACDI